MRTVRLVMGLIMTNCYIVADDSGICAVIDPACDGREIYDTVIKNGFQLTHILFTHTHFDHIMGSEELAKLSGAKLYAFKSEAKYLSMPSMNLSTRSMGSPYSCTFPVIELSDGDIVKVGSLSFEVMHTPGHTVGSVCYICEDVIFSGDTLFEGDAGRTDLPGGDYEELMASLKRLKCLKGDYVVYPGHDIPTTLEHERTHNSFMGKIKI